jgi:hypothetical protein
MGRFDIYEPVHALVAEEGRTLLGRAHDLLHRATIIVRSKAPAEASAGRERPGELEPLGPKVANDMARSATTERAPYWLHSLRRIGCFWNRS